MNETQSSEPVERRIGTKIATALAEAHKNIGAAVKGSANPFFKSRYATLGDVLAVCKEPLAANGLSILQLVGSDTRSSYLETILLHSSGESICSTMTVTPTKPNDLQALGSAITYCRRYALQAMMCIPSVDDDAEWAERALRNRPEASISHDLEAMQAYKADLHRDAMAATGARRAELLNLEADMTEKIEAEEEKRKPQKMSAIPTREALRNPQSEKEETLLDKVQSDDVPMHHPADLPVVEAKIDQVETPSKTARQKPAEQSTASKSEPATVTDTGAATRSNDPLVPELSAWREYQLKLVPAAAYKGRPLGSFSNEEIKILYKKRSLPFLHAPDEALRLEALMIQQAHDGGAAK